MGGLKTLDDWLIYQQNLHTKEIDLGLSRIQKVYQKLFPNGVDFKVITVAGTNGKGSTIAFIASIYQQANIKIGAFTSPHIEQYNERFYINGKMAKDAQICSAFAQIERVRGTISLTYFEFSTLAALLIFASENIQIAALEIGLGGRLDSVNVVDSDAAVITSIDIDHAEFLGSNREAIGIEKAGIMRAGKPCVCGDTKPPKTIQQVAQKIGAKLTFVNQPYLGKISLQGKQQRQNAALAIAAIKLLPDFVITQKQISAGIKNAQLAGRFQSKNINGKTLILDVAHNPAAIEALANTLQKNPQPTLAIFSALKDKDIAQMIDNIAPLIDEWLLLPIESQRAISMPDLSKKFGLSAKIKICENMPVALHQALHNSQVQRIVIFGSFYVVADALKVVKSNLIKP